MSGHGPAESQGMILSSLSDQSLSSGLDPRAKLKSSAVFEWTTDKEIGAAYESAAGSAASISSHKRFERTVSFMEAVGIARALPMPQIKITDEDRKRIDEHMARIERELFEDAFHYGDNRGAGG